MPFLTVIVPAHNPHPGRLRRTLHGLRAQNFPVSNWELLMVDNASVPALAMADIAADAPANLRLVAEPAPGLSHARRRGFSEARGELLLLVDDDNVLAPDFLSHVVSLFAAHAEIGVLGGIVRPEFETPPEPWKREFSPLLALRDLGPTPIVSGLRAAGATEDTYPDCAPVGAGLALRAAAARPWLERADPAALTDRRGGELTSGGDNDIVLHALRAGWLAGYFPELVLTHLIPDGRLDPAYLARLNRGIQKSWMRVLSRHDLNPWPAIPRWTVPLRQARAWFTHRAWTSPAARIRWQGSCGHFEGRSR